MGISMGFQYLRRNLWGVTNLNSVRNEINPKLGKIGISYT